jgi:hypothetical protein
MRRVQDGDRCNMKILLGSILITTLTVCVGISANAQATLDLETGAVFTGYNDVQIPGDQGTRFSLKDDLTPENKVFYRLRFSYTLKSRHTFSLLYAPLETRSRGSVDKDIFFKGQIFSANTPLRSIYKFNSYRLTYRYNIAQKPRFEFGLGFTAKIRDASILLSSADEISFKNNVGFVPIINFRLLWQVHDKVGLLLDGDALAAPQGRAEDISLAATYTFSDNLRIRAGYRILEGGADNDEVYNFALFHYALAGISYTF